jgi:hypothetical protein
MRSRWREPLSTLGRLASVTLLLAAAFLLAACPSRVSIAQINRDPAHYAHKEIAIAGRVNGSFGALGTGVYQIDDGSGTMWVYSSNFGVPARGSEVAVIGQVQQGLMLGGRSFATIMRETERRH